MSGQDPSVTIMANPDVEFYTVGNNLTLMCIADPLPTDTSISITYLWQCSGCFANGMTTPTISRILTDMDNSTIDCSVDIDGNVTMADMMFDLQVTQGTVLRMIVIHSVLCISVFISLTASHAAIGIILYRDIYTEPGLTILLECSS